MKLSCAALAGSFLGLVVLAACSVSPTTGSSGSGDGGGGIACGLAFIGDKWSSACESWSDTYCCDEQSACGASSDCVHLVNCINACPSPHQDSCTDTCSGQAPSSAIDQLTALGNCTKKTPGDGHVIPSTCAWP